MPQFKHPAAEVLTEIEEVSASVNSFLLDLLLIGQELLEIGAHGGGP